MKYVIDVPDKYVSKEDGQLYVALRSEECDESLNPTWVCTGYHCEPYNQQSAFNKGMDSYKSRKYGDCDKCLREFGTLGCCTTVSNQWVYSCEDGMLEYARKEGYAEGWEKGYSDCHDKEIGYKDGYHAGLEDAWECAGKITEICLADAWECFGTDSIGEVIKNHTASEAIQKMKDWEIRNRECDGCQAPKHICVLCKRNYADLFVGGEAE